MGIIKGKSGKGLLSIRSGWIAVAISILFVVVDKIIPIIPEEWKMHWLGILVTGILVLIYNVLRGLQGASDE